MGLLGFIDNRDYGVIGIYRLLVFWGYWGLLIIGIMGLLEFIEYRDYGIIGNYRLLGLCDYWGS